MALRFVAERECVVAVEAMASGFCIDLRWRNSFEGDWWGMTT